MVVSKSCCIELSMSEQNKIMHKIISVARTDRSLLQKTFGSSNVIARAYINFLINGPMFKQKNSDALHKLPKSRIFKLRNVSPRKIWAMIPIETICQNQGLKKSTSKEKNLLFWRENEVNQ